MGDSSKCLKSETLNLNISFTSLATKQRFMNYISGKCGIKISSVEASGLFQGEFLINSDGQGETEPGVVHQLQQTAQVVGSPVTIHPSITEEGGTNLTNETNMPQSQHMHLLPVEHANAPSGDVKVVTVTGSSSHHSSYAQLSKQPVSPPLSSSVSTASDKGTSSASHDKGKDCNDLIKKREHTIFCLLHSTEVSICPFYDTPEECYENYDHTFASGFEQFLDAKRVVLPPPSILIGNKDQQGGIDYMWYIKSHLKSKKCPSFCARLWRFCITNNACHLYKYANEGLLIHSSIRADKIGSLCSDYIDVMNMMVIGEGGFGKVYLYTSPSGSQLAIKRENKHPLVGGDAKLFRRILQLKHPHVIKMLEYIVGPCNETDKLSYLFVMPFMNRKGLDEQFKIEKGCKCVLAFMAKYQNQAKMIFRNFLNLFHQVFDGLSYLKTKQIVHRDIKSSNILVHQSCKCRSPLMCTCPEGNKILYVLGDMDLLCTEGECSLIKSEVWEKMAMHEPAGTIEMKPPESFYRTGEGDAVISHKSDVWSGCVTMMNALVGKGANTVPHTQISAFLKTATKIVKNASYDIDSSCNMLENIITKYTSILKAGSFNAVVTSEMNSISVDFRKLRKVLSEGNTSLKKVQSFQGGIPETYREENPLAGILSTVYVANSLHWGCLTVLPDVYNTPLWKCLCATLDIIAEGVRFIPEDRKDASEIVELLKPIETTVML